jgi:hypothetical protein
LAVFNGNYKDKGILKMQFNLNDKNLYENVTQKEKVAILVNESIGVDVNYEFNQIFVKETNKTIIRVLAFNL